MSTKPQPSLSRLKKAELVALCEAALGRLTAEDRAELLAPFAQTTEPAKARKGPHPAPAPSTFLEQVETFVEDSLAGDYYQLTGRKNERGFYETPEATRTWCRTAERLCQDALRLVRDGQDEAVARGLERLLHMMGQSEGDREIVWAEEWGLSWNVHADFEQLLGAFFTALARTAAPEEFARRGRAIAGQWTWKGHGAEELLRGCAKGAHGKALERASRTVERKGRSRR